MPADLKKSKAQTIALCTEYSHIADIANVGKHRELRDESAVIKSVDDIREVSLCIDYEDSEGRYIHMQKVVLVNIDGERVDIIELLTIVLNFWGNILLTAGVIPSYENYIAPEDPKKLVIPRVNAKSNFGETIVPARSFRSAELQSWKFNYDKNIAERVNLDPSSFRVSLYDKAPKGKLDYGFSYPVLGEKIKVTIDLSEEEFSRVNMQNTTEQKQKAEKWLIEKRWPEIRLKLDAEINNVYVRKYRYKKFTLI